MHIRKIIRSELKIEMLFLIIILFGFLFWYGSLLFQNTFHDPLVARFRYYLINSGFFCLIYLSLALFSYYFIKPVFKKEAKVFAVSVLVLTILVLLFGIFTDFPGSVNSGFSVNFHKYKPISSPQVPVINGVIALCLIVSLKNSIYKAVIFRGEERKLVINLLLMSALIAVSIFLVANLELNFKEYSQMLIFYTDHLVPVFIFYFYWQYISLKRFQFINLHSVLLHKSLLVIVCIVIFLGSIISSLLFHSYEKEYLKMMDTRVSHIYSILKQNKQVGEYDKAVEFIALKKSGSNSTVFLTGKNNAPGDLSKIGKGVPFILKDGKPLIYREQDGPEFSLSVGFSYIPYRQYIHRFAVVAFQLSFIMIFFVFIPAGYLIIFSMMRPFREILKGFDEVAKTDLANQIKVPVKDDVEFVSHLFNTMVENLRNNEERAKTSEKKYRDLSQLLPDIVYETDKDLAVTYLNDAGLILTRYSMRDIKAGITLKDLVPEKDYEYLREILYQGVRGEGLNIFVHKVIRKDGVTIDGETNTVVIFDADGNPAGLRGVIRNVTDKLRLEQRLMQSQKMETIGTLAGGIAHDFNNILSGITGTISLLKFKLFKEKDIYQKINKELDILEISADRAANMVNQILMLSRRRKLAMELIDIKPVLKNVQRMCRDSFDRKIKLNFDFPESKQIYTMGDATHLEQALLNLCVNACDAMTMGNEEINDWSGILSVVLETVQKDDGFRKKYPHAKEPDYCCIMVTDTGAGMDDETLSKIFDPFFTTKEQDKGTGLGLAMVYNIVKQHKGFIDVRSERGVGTTFVIYIPREKPSGNFVEASSSFDKIVKAGEGMVLLIDDDRQLRETAREILEIAGYQVVVARDGQEGIDLFREQYRDISVVILDMMMPRKSGKEAFREIREIDPDARILASSGFRDDPMIREVLLSGVNGFVQKPYTLEELSVAVDAIISHRTSRKGT